MTNGHPEAVDDAILESGNARAKRGKRNIFWGGTSEEGAVYTMDRSRRKRDQASNDANDQLTLRASW